MLPKNNPTKLKSWKTLENIKKCQIFDLRRLFKEDPKRADKFSVFFDDIFFDYSKNLIDEKKRGSFLGTSFFVYEPVINRLLTGIYYIQVY